MKAMVGSDVGAVRSGRQDQAGPGSGSSAASSESAETTAFLRMNPAANRALLEALDAAGAWFRARKTRPIAARLLEADHRVETLEGPVLAKAGDFLCRGAGGELWPQSRASLERRYLPGGSLADGWREYCPRPEGNQVLAASVPQAFEVTSRRGILRGKAGDYVLKKAGESAVPGANDLWIVDRSLFEATYERVGEPLLPAHRVMTTPASLNPALLAGWISTAEALAARAHAGQTRRGGTPYLEHPAAVAAQVPPALRPIAWLHDACEDSDLTPDDLRAAGLPDSVVAAVEAISKGPGEAYEVYLERVLANPQAAAVKCADIAHNLGSQPKPESRAKYLRALPRLLPVASVAWPEVRTVLGFGDVG